jgi:hypothetical protein
MFESDRILNLDEHEYAPLLLSEFFMLNCKMIRGPQKKTQLTSRRFELKIPSWGSSNGAQDWSLRAEISTSAPILSNGVCLLLSVELT